MKRILVIIGLVCLIMSSGAYALTGFDLSDRVVIAYELSATQEAQYSSTDNKVAPFWAIWGLNETTLDHIYMDPNLSQHAQNRSENGFDLSANPPDAATTIRYAYGANGLYLYWAQEDDQFVGVIQPGADVIFRNDGTDFQFDSHSSAEIYANNYWIGTKALTQNEVQFQQLFGGAGGEVLSWYRRSYYDGATDYTLIPVQVSWADGKTQFQIEVEIVPVDVNNRIQEWMIPWSQVGNPGLGSKPLAGKQIAHVCHYNDLDGSTTDLEDILIWNQGSTYGGQGSGSSPAWCDIEFGPKVDDVIISAVRPVSKIKTSSRVLSTEYFTLSGKRLPVVNNVVNNMGNTLVIKREILENGQVKSSMTGLVK